VQPPIHAYLPFVNAARPLLEKHFPGRRIVCWSQPDEFAAGIAEAVYLFTLHPPRGHWQKAEALRLIQAFGAGVDYLLPASGLRDEVVIANQRGMSADSMAEFGLSLVLALLKQLPYFTAAQRRHAWERRLPERAAGKTLGILGLGAIGLALAERAHALGMRVIGTQREPKAHPAVARIDPPEATARVLAESDVVVILVPLTERTRGAIGARELAAMKPSASLVNLARGGIVDEAALGAALAAGRIASAAFDVFATEPLPADHPLWDAPNFWVTPHVAGGFPDLLDVSIGLFADNVARLERGEPVASAVDRARGY
jgi:phosphoglycerate dehydrogenase-like enzyme